MPYHPSSFPVRSTDNRCCYRRGSAPGFSLALALVAALSGYAGFSHAAPCVHAEAGQAATVSAGVSPGPSAKPAGQPGSLMK